MTMLEQFFEACGEDYKQGNKWALMQVIWVCAQKKIPLPEWATKEYILAYETAQSGKARSWDDLFDRPYPKGTHLNAVYKKHKTLWPLFWYVRKFLEENPNTPIDDCLFETVGQKFNIGKTLASEYYYEARECHKKEGLI